jgi:hypothetical protein
MKFAADDLREQALPVSTPKQLGDPNHPSSFSNFSENEIKSAAYLGFQHTSALRSLAVSYPVLDPLQIMKDRNPEA